MREKPHLVGYLRYQGVYINWRKSKTNICELGGIKCAVVIFQLAASVILQCTLLHQYCCVSVADEYIRTAHTIPAFITFRYFSGYLNCENKAVMSRLFSKTFENLL